MSETEIERVVGASKRGEAVPSARECFVAAEGGGGKIRVNERDDAQRW